MRPGIVIVALWLAWALSWIAAAFWSTRAEKRIELKSALSYRIPMTIGFILLAIPAHGYEGPLRLWHIGWSGAWGCALLLLLGFAFTWWARIHLGKLWSGAITKKADHHIVDTGPYGWVRHPIYTGLITALLGTMLAKGTVEGVVGVAVAILGIWIKARLEENWLRGELGAEAYDSYRKRVPMLIPFGPKAK